LPIPLPDGYHPVPDPSDGEASSGRPRLIAKPYQGLFRNQVSGASE